MCAQAGKGGRSVHRCLPIPLLYATALIHSKIKAKQQAGSQ
jgi:hypothetical protein